MPMYGYLDNIPNLGRDGSDLITVKSLIWDAPKTKT